MPRTPRTTRTPPTSVAPERDYTKVANSIVREAVAGGYFTGKSKQLYDFLYFKTRGAVVPVRSIRITKPKLMAGSGIGSERTLLKNLAYLRSIGLIVVNVTDGEHGGNEYTVNMPEEVNLEPTPRTPPTPPTVVQGRHAPQEVGMVPSVESAVGNVGSNSLESTTSEASQTSSLRPEKKIDDDEPAALLLRLLQEAEREVAGKAGDPQRWSEPLGIIIAALKVAASRSSVISSAPAFLAEHLRRRLGKAERQATQPVGSPNTSEQAKPSAKREFTEEPCIVCKGSLMEDHPEGGKRRCTHCRDEFNYPTGREPKDI